MLHVIANLDVEARLASVTLPGKALEAIADAGTLLRALLPATATEKDATLWLPATVDPARLVEVPGLLQPLLAQPRLAVGQPERIAEGDEVQVWAIEDKHLHHRRLAHDLARRLGHAYPTARFIHSVDELRSHLDATGVASWVVKAPYSAAGRDRHIEPNQTGATRLSERAELSEREKFSERAELSERAKLSEQAEKRVRRLLRQHRELLFEPWVDRDLGGDSLDFGMLGTVFQDGKVELLGPHRLLVDAQGHFSGIELGPLPWRLAEHVTAKAAATAAGEALAAIGYHGPFGVDGYRFRTPDGIALQPLGEINARLTFGWIAHAVAHAVARAIPTATSSRLKLCFGRDVPESTDAQLVVPLLRAGPGRRATWAEPKIRATRAEPKIRATRAEPKIRATRAEPKIE